MSENSVPSPAKKIVPAPNSPVATVAVSAPKTSVPASGKPSSVNYDPGKTSAEGASRTKDHRANSTPTGDEEGSGPALKSGTILTLVMGVVAVILLISTFVFWSQVKAREETITVKQNRTAQAEAALVQMQARLDETAAATTRLQKQKDEAQAESGQLKTELAKAKADTADTQILLDKSRVIATEFQMQMEEAKVASLKHQGEVETAQAQTAVMKSQMGKATAEVAQLQSKLTVANALATDLQEKLTKAENSLSLLLRSPARK